MALMPGLKMVGRFVETSFFFIPTRPTASHVWTREKMTEVVLKKAKRKSEHKSNKRGHRDQER